MSDNFSEFDEKLSTGCQNCILRVQTNILAFSKTFPKRWANIVFSVNANGTKTHHLRRTFCSRFIINVAQKNKIFVGLWSKYKEINLHENAVLAFLQTSGITLSEF